MNFDIGQVSSVLWEANARLEDARASDDDIYDHARDLYIDGCGFGVLTLAFVRRLIEFIGDRKALDAGAGRGIMTDALAEGGVDCVGVDKHIIPTPFGSVPKHVIEMDAVDAVDKFKPDVLILCWPTPPEDDRTEWAARTLEAFEGEHVVVIGHHTLCATHRFWTGLFENWEDQGIDLNYDVSLHDNVGILDGCAVYARKR